MKLGLAAMTSKFRMRRKPESGARGKHHRVPFLCIDFGVSATKVAVASSFGKRARIAEVVAVAPGPDALKALIEERGWQGARVRALVQEEHLYWRSTTVPKLKRRRHLTSLLELESKKHAPDSWDEYQWNYRSSGAGTLDPAFQAIAVGAVTRKTISEVRRAVEAAGLRLDRLIPYPEAARGLAPVSDGTEASALLDLGSDHCRLTIVHRGEAVLYRQLGVGGQHLTEELTTVMIPGRAALSFTPDEAEEMKCRHGILHEAGSDEFEGDLPLGQIGAAIHPILERMVRDLYSTFDYWNERYMDAPLGGIHLFGGTAALPGLAPYLESVLGLSVVEADAPLGAPGDLPPSHLLAAGLALVPGDCLDISAVEPPDSLDLLEKQVTWSRVAAVLLLLLGLGGGITGYRLARETSRHAVWQGRITGQEAQAEILRHIEERDAAKRRMAEIRGQLTGTAPDWPSLLAGVSRHMVEDAPLTGLALDRETSPDGLTTTQVLRLSGRLTGSRPAPEIMADLLRTVSAVPGLEPAQLVTTRTDENGHEVFDVRSTLKAGMFP